MSELVPDGFDLEMAKAMNSSTDPSERKRCPDCESVDVSHHTNNFGRSVDYGYTCATCGNRFDDPVYLDVDDA